MIQSGLIALSALLGTTAFADVNISGDWVKLGDVAPVTGEAADRRIAAAPLPGQRLPLSADFIEAQAQAAGYPIMLENRDPVWVTGMDREAVEVAEPREAPVVRQDMTGLVPVLTTTLNRGDIITADMITYEGPDPKRRVQGLIRDAGYLKDMEAKRTLRAGQPLSLRDIQPVSIIKKGDPVVMVYQTGALKLTVNAKALSNAAQGETVRLMNLQSKRAMDATAVAPGEARVGPIFPS